MKPKNKPYPPIDWEDEEQVKKVTSIKGIKKRYSAWLENENKKAINKLPNELRQFL